MKMIKAIFFVICFFLGMAEALCQDQTGTIKTISVDDFKNVVDSLEDEVLIDLRTPDEVKGGIIEGAMVIDYFGPDFESAIQKLDRNKVYALYCAGGGRSGETAEIMDKLGFKKIYNLEGGFNAWSKKKMPIKKSNQ